MDILQYFHERADLTEEQVRKVSSLFKTKKYAKKEQIIPMYSHSNKLYFIAEGIIRIYYLKNDKDITHMFFTEGQITVPVENVFYNKPSPYAMEALEDCAIQIADYRELEKVLFEIPALQKLAQSIYIDVISRFSNRLYAMQFQTAKERYDSLMELHPDIILRAPLGHIASYLGITQQTLSVIRAEKG